MRELSSKSQYTPNRVTRTFFRIMPGSSDVDASLSSVGEYTCSFSRITPAAKG